MNGAGLCKEGSSLIHAAEARIGGARRSVSMAAKLGPAGSSDGAEASALVG